MGAEDLPRRKNIRLPNYNYSDVAAYFVTVCVKDRHEIFWQDDVGGDAHIAPSQSNYDYSLSEYGLVVEKYIKRISGIKEYIIMPNHIHMIIRISDKRDDVGIVPYTNKQSLSQIIKSFKTLVTKELGFSIWQRSFYDRVIRSPKEYDVLAKYIYENPIKWQDDCYYQEHNL